MSLAFSSLSKLIYFSLFFIWYTTVMVCLVKFKYININKKYLINSNLQYCRLNKSNPKIFDLNMLIQHYNYLSYLLKLHKKRMPGDVYSTKRELNKYKEQLK